MFCSREQGVEHGFNVFGLIVAFVLWILLILVALTCSLSPHDTEIPTRILLRGGEFSIFGITNVLVVIGCLVLIRGSTKVCLIIYIMISGSLFTLVLLKFKQNKGS